MLRDELYFLLKSELIKKRKLTTLEQLCIGTQQAFPFSYLLVTETCDQN